MAGTRNPDGTATLTGHDLPFDEVAAACAHLDALAAAAKAAGHPDRLDHLRADLLTGLLTGRYSAMNDQQILAQLRADAAVKPAGQQHTRPDGERPGERPDEGPGGERSGEGPDEGPGGERSGEGPDEGPGGERSGDEDPDDAAPDHAAPDDEAPDDEAPDVEAPDDEAPPSGGSSGGAVGRRGGLRLYAGLATLMGADQRPAELLGWGPIHAELAADIARSLRSWWCVLTDAAGSPQAIVPVYRRATGGGVRRAGEVWLQVDAEGLDFLRALDRIGLVDPGWSAILAEITTRLDGAATGPPNADPTARLPAAALRRWIHVRDRRCSFPGCRAPAHRSETDHSIEYARGGATVDAGLAPACRHDHRLRHDGDWIVEHTAPGHLTWTSPLGQVHQRRPPPGLHELPEPRAGALDERDPVPDPEDPPPRSDPDSCLEPEPQPPPPPASNQPHLPAWILPRPRQPDDDDIPPF